MSTTIYWGNRAERVAVHMASNPLTKRGFRSPESPDLHFMCLLSSLYHRHQSISLKLFLAFYLRSEELQGRGNLTQIELTPSMRITLSPFILLVSPVIVKYLFLRITLLWCPYCFLLNNFASTWIYICWVVMFQSLNHGHCTGRFFSSNALAFTLVCLAVLCLIACFM